MDECFYISDRLTPPEQPTEDFDREELRNVVGLVPFSDLTVEGPTSTEGLRRPAVSEGASPDTDGVEPGRRESALPPAGHLSPQIAGGDGPDWRLVHHEWMLGVMDCPRMPELPAHRKVEGKADHVLVEKREAGLDAG